MARMHYSPHGGQGRRESWGRGGDSFTLREIARKEEYVQSDSWVPGTVPNVRHALSLNPPMNSMHELFLSGFVDQKSEAQRCEVTSPRTHS